MGPGQPRLERLPRSPGTRFLAAPHELLEREGPRPQVGHGQHRFAHVLAGHPHHQVGLGEQLAAHGATAVGGDVETAPGENLHAWSGGRLVSPYHARRVHSRLDAEGVEPAAEEGLGHGRAADVARAEEEDVDAATLVTWAWLATLPAVALDPRTPVIGGVAQTLRRPEPQEATEPLDQMVEALELAAADSGSGRTLLERADSVRVVAVLSWRYTDPGALVAGRLGIQARQTVVTTTGGNSPQMLVNDTAAAIQRGEVDVALLAGAEAMYTRQRSRRAKVFLDWPVQEGATPAQVLGEDRPGTSDVEMARALALPIQIDPIFESALRAAARAVFCLAGVGIDDVAHVDLYSCFPSAVQIGAAELGLGLAETDRPLTVTGGLSFAGGPGNNYSTHAIATMVERLRDDPGAMGLVTALGWYLTKHAVGLYST